MVEQELGHDEVLMRRSQVSNQRLDGCLILERHDDNFVRTCSYWIAIDIISTNECYRWCLQVIGNGIFASAAA
jgi:hypothetical protein